MFELHLRKLNQCLFNSNSIFTIPAFMLILGFSPVTAAKELSLGTGEFPPYISNSLDGGGALTKIVTSAFAKSGYQTSVDFIPWTRALKLTDSVRIDGSFAWSIKADRKVKFLYSKPLFIFEQRAFSLKNNQIDISANAPLGSVDLCRPQGYATQGLSKTLIENGVANHFSPPDVETCFNMLKVGRVDIVVVDKLEGQSYVEKQFSNISDVKTLDRAFHKYSNHFIISKKHPRGAQLLKDFNIGLDELMESGEYQQILFDELGL